MKLNRRQLRRLIERKIISFKLLTIGRIYDALNTELFSNEINKRNSSIKREKIQIKVANLTKPKIKPRSLFILPKYIFFKKLVKYFAKNEVKKIIIIKLIINIIHFGGKLFSLKKNKRKLSELFDIVKDPINPKKIDSIEDTSIINPLL